MTINNWHTRKPQLMCQQRRILNRIYRSMNYSEIQAWWNQQLLIQTNCIMNEQIAKLQRSPTGVRRDPGVGKWMMKIFHYNFRSNVINEKLQNISYFCLEPMCQRMLFKKYMLQRGVDIFFMQWITPPQDCSSIEKIKIV